MKSPRKLSRLGRLRRFRKLARRALEFYRLKDARLTFLAYEGNTIYRADVAGQGAPTTGSDFYVPGRYVVRAGLGVRAELDRMIGWDSKGPDTLLGPVMGLTMGPKGGLYAFLGQRYWFSLLKGM